MGDKQTTSLGGIAKFLSWFAAIIWIPAYIFDYIALANIFFGVWVVSGLLVWIYKI